jgi:hypothetical protein
MENKGLNFLAGLGGLWLLWKLYSIGWLHAVGFLAIDSTFGTDLSYNCAGVFSGDQLFGVTPLALFASLLIDAVAVFGALLIVVVSGLWQLAMQLGAYLKDLSITLKEYLDGFRKDVVPDPIPNVDPVVVPDVKPEVEPEVESEVLQEVKDKVVTEESPLEIILLEIQGIKTRQVDLLETQKILNDNQISLKAELDNLKDKPNE